MAIPIPEFKSEYYVRWDEFVKVNKQLGLGAVDAHENAPDIVKEAYNKGEEDLMRFLLFLINF